MSGYSDAVLALSPLVYFRLGETSGTTAVDSSGNGHNGTYHGSPTFGQPSAVADSDGAVLFDGVDDYMEGSIDLSTHTSLSVAFWFKASSSPNNTMLLTVGDTGHNWRDHSLSFWYDWSSGNFAVEQTAQFFNPTDYARIGVEATSPTVGAYHFAVATLNPASSGTLTLYLDCSLVNSSGGLGGSISHSDVIYLARDYVAGTYTPCTLDEVAIFPSVLSLTDVEDLCAARVSAAAYWGIKGN